jgi:uncharacterized protein DUF4142
MLTTLAFLLLASTPPPETTTLPRQQDKQAYENTANGRDNAKGTPTDPLFDRELVATDDPSFILSAIEDSRQAALDARAVEKTLPAGPLRDTATAIGTQNESTTRKLESLAQRKGWRLPAQNPSRTPSSPSTNEHRASANFIVSQISAHQATLAKYNAQIAGKGDSELKSALKQAVPGIRKNLLRLLEVKP